MGRCATCGNNYESTFTVTKEGDSYEFDSFECAIQKLAPTCDACGCRVIGHGVQAGGQVFCCAHCARREGVESVADRA